MTISKDLFLAILSMDSYNQGYGRGIEHGKTQIGAATKRIESDTETTAETSASAAAGFYAIAYDVDGSGPSGLAGITVAPNHTP
ncbi:MAG TPA: hypothetical protein ENK34_05210 [Rhodobacteraceae bacterium]|nr:hypothetical protein [Paracoccaceae bacterium]